jgi:hypothetical protein
MFSHRFSLLIMFVCVAWWLSGCQDNLPGSSPADDPPSDIFGAKQLQVASGATVTIDNRINGEVQVTAYPGNEVALDFVVTGYGTSEDLATAEALHGILVTLESVPGGVQVLSRQNPAAPGALNPQDHILLHLRVPQTSPVDVKGTNGNIKVEGVQQPVTVHTNAGTITARGIAGDLTLSTEQGPIDVDERDVRDAPARHLSLKATGGNISIFAVSVSVDATATNGSIQFVGTLIGSDNTFTASGTGNVVVALPNRIYYRYRALGGTRVLTDFPNDVEACGNLGETGDYDFSMRPSSSELGRAEIAGDFTTTSLVQGTMGKGVFFFETDRKTAAFFEPLNQAPRTPGPAPSRGWVGDCGRVTTPNLDAAKIDFTARADTGDIWIHQIAAQK